MAPTPKGLVDKNAWQGGQRGENVDTTIIEHVSLYWGVPLRYWGTHMQSRTHGLFAPRWQPLGPCRDFPRVYGLPT